MGVIEMKKIKIGFVSPTMNSAVSNVDHNNRLIPMNTTT